MGALVADLLALGVGPCVAGRDVGAARREVAGVLGEQDAAAVVRSAPGRDNRSCGATPRRPRATPRPRPGPGPPPRTSPADWSSRSAPTWPVPMWPVPTPRQPTAIFAFAEGLARSAAYYATVHLYLLALSLPVKIDAQKNPLPAIFLFLLAAGLLWFLVVQARRRDARKARPARGGDSWSRRPPRLLTPRAGEPKWRRAERSASPACTGVAPRSSRARCGSSGCRWATRPGC